MARDYQLYFGETAAALTASAAGYCATVLDFEDGDTYFSSTVPIKIVFEATSACAGFAPAVYTGDTAEPTDEHVLATGVTLAVGETVEYILPIFKGTRYMRAGGKATSGKVKAWLTVGTPKA